MRHPGESSVQTDRLRRLVAYWEGKRSGRSLPGRADLDPVEIPDLLGHVFLLGAADDEGTAGDWRFRVFGTRLAANVGRDATGDRLDRPDACWFTSAVRNLVGSALVAGAPVASRLERPASVPCRAAAPATETVDLLVVPFGPAAGQVTHILGIADFAREAARSGHGPLWNAF